MRLPFRADIDYLRAIAVLSVIGFHYNLAGFSGGFVGVDIFFVISGHVITRLLWSDIQANSFSFWGFYERRARRLLPALYVMILLTGIAAWFLAPPADYATFFASAVSTLLFSSNIFFWLQTGYFDLPSIGKVLIHTWSLSVEEQFYFMFPLITWLWSKCFRDPASGPSLALLVAGATALCVADELLIKGSAPAAFYLAPLRAWEFLLGSLSLFMLRWSPADFRARCGCALAGAALMAGPVILFTAQTRFPGFQALIPCLGATLFIIAFNRDGRKPPLPAEAIGLFLGKLSYSLYLWHWPVFILGRATMPLAWADSLLATAGLLLCSLGLAYASYLLVETPARERLQWRGVRVSGLIAAAATVLVAICAVGVAESGYPDRFAKSEQRMLRYNGQTIESVYRIHTCFLQPSDPISHYRPAECLAFAPDRLNILLFGDSAAGHYFAALRQYLPPQRYNLLQLNAAACAPFIGVRQPQSENCDQANAMFTDLLKDRRIAAVILSGNWRYYFEAHQAPLTPGTSGRSAALTSRFDAHLDATLSAAEDANMPILLLGPSLEFPLPLPPNLVRYEQTHMPMGSALKPPAGSFSANEQMRRLSRLYRNVQFASVLDAICSNQDCPLKADADTPMVWDTLHLTPEGANYVVQRLRPALDSFLDRLMRRREAQSNGEADLSRCLDAPQGLPSGIERTTSACRAAGAPN